uniref:Uncharacterized protein n=1 Tax=Phakopsora pachyrhizi TaxID=170000 RepID=A0A0S1MJA0_PHAPC
MDQSLLVQLVALSCCAVRLLKHPDPPRPESPRETDGRGGRGNKGFTAPVRLCGVGAYSWSY